MNLLQLVADPTFACLQEYLATCRELFFLLSIYALPPSLYDTLNVSPVDKTVNVIHPPF
jgi:hypothetical protein